MSPLPCPAVVGGKRERAFLTMEKRLKFIVDEKGREKGILLSLKNSGRNGSPCELPNYY
jgi:hypothetical protein